MVEDRCENAIAFIPNFVGPESLGAQTHRPKVIDSRYGQAGSKSGDLIDVGKLLEIIATDEVLVRAATLRIDDDVDRRAIGKVGVCDVDRFVTELSEHAQGLVVSLFT